MVAVQILVELLEGSDESAKQEFVRVIECSGCTVRNAEEEAALCKLVSLADVHSGFGLGEPPDLEDAGLWANAGFMDLREQGRMELSAGELCDFLCDAYENSVARGRGAAPVGHEDPDAAAGFESVTLSPEEAISGHVGKVAVFYVPEDPHPGIEDMLDILGVPHERTVYRERAAILGFLSDVNGIRHGGEDGEARAWGAALLHSDDGMDVAP